MKELLQGLWAISLALIVSVFMFSVGTVYSLCYAIYLSVTFKKWYACFKFLYKLVDGFCASVGYILFETAYGLDTAWNVNGEILEDCVTSEENTTFSHKNISVSASVGKLEIEGKLNRTGRIFSRLLNICFLQKRHAIDSWNFLQAKHKLREQYFE